MKIVWGIAGVLLALTLLIVAISGVIQSQSAQAEIERMVRFQTEQEKAALALAADQENATRWRMIGDVAAPVVAFGLVVLVLAASGALALTAAGLAAWHRRHPLTVTGVSGTVVSRELLTAGTLQDLSEQEIVGYHLAQVELARATRVTVPHSLHYAPVHHVTTHHAPPAALPAPTAAALPAAPSFAGMTLGHAIETGLFAQHKGYLHGFTLTGDPIWVAPGDGRSMLRAGQGGSGKSTAAASDALQELLIPPHLLGCTEPARYLLIDPHAAKPQSLTRRLIGLGDRIVLHAVKPDEVARVCDYFMAEGRRRLDRGISPYPLVLLADEVSMLYDDPDYEDVRPALTAAFIRANTQYRAVGGKAVVAVHMLQAHAFGGKATIRRSFFSRAAGRLDPGDGQLLGLALSHARALPSLAPGHFILTAPGLQPTRGIGLDLGADDVRRVCDSVPALATARTIHAVPRRTTEAIPVASVAPVAVAVAVASPVAHVASPVAPVAIAVTSPVAPVVSPVAPVAIAASVAPELHAKIDQALGLFDSGADLPDAIEAAFGVSRKSPGPYSTAYRLVQTTLRTHRQAPTTLAGPAPSPHSGDGAT